MAPGPAETEENKERKKFAKLKDGMAKQMADKAMGHACGSGMNMAGEEDSTNETKKKSCKFCKKPGHATNRAKACKHHGWTIEQVQAEMVSIHTSRAREEAARVATAVEASEVQSEGAWEMIWCLLRHRQHAI
jgi:hypothetical protein